MKLMKHSESLRRALAMGALYLIQIASAEATVSDVPTLSISSPLQALPGSSFSAGIDLSLPAGSVGSVLQLNAKIFYFDETLPDSFYGTTPLVLTSVSAGSLLDAGTQNCGFSASYVFCSTPQADPRKPDGYQAIAFFSYNPGATTLAAPAGGTLLNLGFQLASTAEASSIPLRIDVGLLSVSNPNDPLAVPTTTSLELNTNVSVLRAPVAAPEPSPAVLMAAGLVLVIAGRRKLRLSLR